MQLIFAAVVMGARGIVLIATATWAFTFKGGMSKELKRVLNGHSLTAAAWLLLVIGLVLVACAVGVLMASKMNRWVGLISRLIGVLIGIVGAVSGLRLVVYYPGWAITYTVLGTLVVVALSMYERELQSP